MTHLYYHIVRHLRDHTLDEIHLKAKVTHAVLRVENAADVLEAQFIIHDLLAEAIHD